MQDKYLFEYAVIRVVPKVEREEFLNVGVIVFCSGLNFLEAKVKLDEKRLSVFCNDLDLEILRQNLQAIVAISKGNLEGGPISKLDRASRFRWLTATRSTVVQSSKVHPGFCSDPYDTLEKLYFQLVD